MKVKEFKEIVNKIHPDYDELEIKISVCDCCENPFRINMVNNVVFVTNDIEAIDG